MRRAVVIRLNSSPPKTWAQYSNRILDVVEEPKAGSLAETTRNTSGIPTGRRGAFRRGSFSGCFSGCNIGAWRLACALITVYHVYTGETDSATSSINVTERKVWTMLNVHA